MFTWIHTCPSREALLDPLLASLDRSDIESFEVRRCDASGLAAVEQWCLEQLDELTQQHEWVLRLEDDIVVSPHLCHNLQSWPARRCPYFGVGLGFRFSWHIDEWNSWHTDAQTGSMWANDQVAGAQVLLVRSEMWPRIRQYLPRMAGSMMDLGLTAAVRLAGLRTYVHRPSLAQTTEVSWHEPLHKNNQHEHFALDYEPSYRRPDGEQRDQRVLEWTEGKVTRYLPCHDGSVLAVLVDPRKRDVDFASNFGSPCIVDHSKLFDDPNEAAARVRRPA